MRAGDIDDMMRRDILIGNGPHDSVRAYVLYNKVAVGGRHVRPRKAHRISRILKGKTSNRDASLAVRYIVYP